MNDESLLKARIDARKEAEAILDLITETTLRFADKDIRRHFLEIIDQTVHTALSNGKANPHLEAIRQLRKATRGTVTTRQLAEWLGVSPTQLCEWAPGEPPTGKPDFVERTEQEEKKPLPPDVREALEVCDEMESLAEEVPSAGEDFAFDVLEKMRSIRGTIERSKSVTVNQKIALENMCSGLARWIRD